jgi:hypothetical protein
VWKGQGGECASRHANWTTEVLTSAFQTNALARAKQKYEAAKHSNCRLVILPPQMNAACRNMLQRLVCMTSALVPLKRLTTSVLTPMARGGRKSHVLAPARSCGC